MATIQAAMLSDQPESELQDRVRELRPLRWFLVLWVVVVYAWSAQWWQLLVNPSEGISFVALLALHAAGHWTSPRLIGRPRRLAVYLVAQGLLVLALSYISRNPLVAFLLSIALAGTAVLLLWNLQSGIVAVGACLVLLVIASTLNRRPLDLAFFIAFGLPLMLFTAGGAALFIRQANARLRAQALLRELEASHRQLSEYAGRVEELTLSAERQRLARELHDTLAQGLAGLIMQLEAIDTHLERGASGPARDVTLQAMARARQTLAEARRAIQALRTVSPESGHVLDALRREVDQFTSATGVPCALEIGAGEWSVSSAAAEHSLRIVQEGLANIARHAQARHAWVRWNCRDDELELAVQDDGSGFDPADEARRDGHFGLIGLRERVQLAGGEFEIESALGGGTCLVAHLPLGAGEARYG